MLFTAALIGAMTVRVRGHSRPEQERHEAAQESESVHQQQVKNLRERQTRMMMMMIIY